MLAQRGPALSPDGEYYRNDPWKRPYCMRRFYPWLMQKAGHKTWQVVSTACLILAGALVGTHFGSFWHTVLFMALPIARVCTRFPVLTDAPALACFAVGLYTGNPWIMALGGLFNEKVPIFGAFALWSPWPLLGVVPPLVLYLKGKPAGGTDPDWLRNPVKAALSKWKRLSDPQFSLLPWGPCLLAFPHLPLKGVCTLILAYLQCLVAQDGARLYQWAVFALQPVIPPEWVPSIAVLAWANPWRDAV